MASWNDLCRCCLSPNSKVSLLDGTNNVKEKFREITTIEVVEDDGLPRYLCCDCNTIMNSAYQFRQQCLRLDSELRLQLQSLVQVDEAAATEAEEITGDPVRQIAKNVKSEPSDSDDDNYYVLVIDDPKDKGGHAEKEEKNDKGVEDSVEKETEPPANIKSEVIQNVDESTNDEPETEMSVVQQEEITSDSFETSSYYISNTRVSANVPATILENEEEGQTMEELFVASMEEAENQNSNSQEHILPDVNIENEHDMTEDNDNIQEVQIQAMDEESGDGEQENSNTIKILATTNADGTIVLKGTDGIQYFTDTRLVAGEDGQLHEEEVIYCDGENNPQFHILKCDDSELVIEYSGDTDQIATVYQQEDGSFLCECGEQFNDLEEYEKHQFQHNPAGDHLCNLCGKGFESPEILSGHLVLHRVTGPIIQCPYCSQQMKRNSLTQHIKFTHSNLRPECNVCGKQFANSNNLKRHMNTHTGIRQFECDICFKRFYQKITMQTHRLKHVSPFACTDCDLLFDNKEEVLAHKNLNQCVRTQVTLVKQDLIETVKKKITTNLGKLLGYACSLCKKMFSVESALEQHVESVHMSEQHDFTCQECGDLYSTKKGLQTHMVAHKIYKNKNTKRFECTLCNKSCASHAMLIMHERVHTNERPYGCELCTRRFKTKTHLRTHQLTHTREKKFGCSVCMKFFALKGNLVVHLRTHTGERPYSCTICNESFIDSKYLKKHKLKRHNISNAHWNEY